MHHARRLDIFDSLGDRGRFGLHGQKSSDQEDGGASELRNRETFVKNQRRQTERADRAKQLQALSKRDSDLADRYIVQNVG